jgi:drug/metabolite transporter (DMT)-like permease
VKNQRGDWLGYYLLVGVVWGCSFLFIAMGNDFLTTAGVAFWRMALGGLPMLALALSKGGRFPSSPIAWFHLLVTSLCMNSIPAVLFSFAERHVTSGFAGIMNAATPVATILMILVFFRAEKPSAQVLGGLAIGLIGVLIVLAVWNGVGATSPEAVSALTGAVLLYGFGGPYARRFVSPLGLDGTVQVSAQVLLAGITLAPFYFSGPLLTSTPSIWGVLGMIIFGVMGTGFAYLWYYRLMALAGSAVANAVTFLSPVVAVLVGAAVLAEQVTWNEVVGGAIVIIGAAYGQGRFDNLFRKLFGRPTRR